MLIPEKHLEDTLTFSLVGFQELNFTIRYILSKKIETYSLKVKSIPLEQVEVSTQKLHENKYGITKIKPGIQIIDASLNQNDIFEIAQLIRLKPKISKLTSIDLLIGEPSTDSVSFRINFYEFDGNQPTKRLIETKITEKQKVKAGWLRVDLKKYNVYLKGPVVASFEFIPDNKYNPVHYEVKLGGTSRSFFRSSSLGQWHTPPHHYRMYVTVLEEFSQGKKETETEDVELVPSTRFYSEHVKDTFSLFVQLPTGYNKNKTKVYPVILLLDANMYFELLSNSIKSQNKDNKLTEPIVIGIGYKNIIACDSLRNRDYTYPVALAKDSFQISGGADKFLTFLTDELIPYIHKNFRADSLNRSLMGHSLGGYFTLFALQKQLRAKKSVFRYYVSASPSIDYSNQFIYAQFQNIPDNFSNTTELSLLLTTGSLEVGEAGGRDFNSFARLLAEEKFRNIRLTKIIIPYADHMGAAMLAFEKGIEFIMKP